MCTIILLHQVHPEFPVIIAANRDEYYARPSTMPERLLSSPIAIGGRDGRKGGTWMGATAHGFFVGLTNQRTFKPADASLRSRGDVVLESLRLGTTKEVRTYLQTLRPQDYNPFNLVFGTASGLWVAYAHHETTQVVLEPVPQGLHVLPNDRLNSDAFRKVKRAQTLLDDKQTLPWDQLLPHLQQTLADRSLPAFETMPKPPTGTLIPKRLLHQLEALCIHTPLYGTCSATITALAPQNTAHYLFAPKAPNRTQFQDCTPLFTGSTTL